MEDKEKKPAENKETEELKPDQLESVAGGYPFFRDLSTDDEKRRTT